MAKIMTCDLCGKRYEIDSGGEFDEAARQFVCPDCMALNHASDNRPVRPSLTGTAVTKLIFGGIFLAFGISELLSDLSSALFGIAIGLPLVLWALTPWFSYSKASKEYAEKENRVSQEKIRIRKEKDDTPRICPGCGATTHGKTCEYCGTKLI